MGNSRITKNSTLHQQEVWKSGKQLTQFKGKPYISYLVSNKFQTQYVGLEFIVQPQEQNFQASEQMMMYQLRQCMNHSNVIGVYSFNKGKTIYKFYDKELDSNKSVYRVITQYLQIRLCDMKLLNVKQGLQILKCATYGVWQIYKHLGGFTITPQMIGIDNKGNVKVWINSNFGENTVQFEVKQEIGQREMCLQLFKIIDKSIFGSEKLPNRIDMLSVESLSQLANYLYRLTQCETNKELMLQLILKEKTFKNIQQTSKPLNKDYNNENLKNIPAHQKIIDNKNKMHINLSGNDASNAYSSQQNSAQMIGNQRENYYLYSYPDKPIYTKNSPFTVSNRQSYQKYYHHQPQNIPNNFQFQSSFQKEFTQLKHQNQKSQNLLKQSLSNQNENNQKKQARTFKKNNSSANFNQFNMPSLQTSQQQFNKNKKNYQSQFINTSEMYGSCKEDIINSIDSPNIKYNMTKIKKYSDRYNGNQNKNFGRSPLHFIKNKKLSYSNKSFDIQNAKVDKQTNSLAQNQMALPVEANNSSIYDNNSNNSVNMNSLNSSTNVNNFKVKTPKLSKQQSQMIKADFQNLFNDKVQKPTNSNLFESKDYLKNSFASIVQEYDRKKFSQAPVFHEQPSEIQAINNQSQKNELEFSKNNKSECQLISYKQNQQADKNEPILQKLHFSKQKKFNNRINLYSKNQNDESNRKRSRGIMGQNYLNLIKDQYENSSSKSKKEYDDSQQNSLLIDQGKFPTTFYHLSSTNSITSKILQSYDLDVQSFNMNENDSYTISYLNTIKETQREKDLSSHYEQQSDRNELGKQIYTSEQNIRRI